MKRLGFTLVAASCLLAAVLTGCTQYSDDEGAVGFVEAMPDSGGEPAMLYSQPVEGTADFYAADGGSVEMDVDYDTWETTAAPQAPAPAAPLLSAPAPAVAETRSFESPPPPPPPPARERSLDEIIEHELGYVPSMTYAPTQAEAEVIEKRDYTNEPGALPVPPGENPADRNGGQAGMPPATAIAAAVAPADKAVIEYDDWAAEYRKYMVIEEYVADADAGFFSGEAMAPPALSAPSPTTVAIPPLARTEDASLNDFSLPPPVTAVVAVEPAPVSMPPAIQYEGGMAGGDDSLEFFGRLSDDLNEEMFGE